MRIFCCIDPGESPLTPLQKGGTGSGSPPFQRGIEGDSHQSRYKQITHIRMFEHSFKLHVVEHIASGDISRDTVAVGVALGRCPARQFARDRAPPPYPP